MKYSRGRNRANEMAKGDYLLLMETKNRQQQIMQEGEQMRKRKYHRKVKAFQKNHVQDLKDANAVLLELAVPQAHTKRYEVMLLFFAVRNQIYLLIGREKITG
jgi:ribosomal protein S17